VGNVHQCDVNWLLDPRLVDARLRWHKGLLNIAGISDHIAELEAMWEKLSWLSDEKTLLVQMTGLIQARRDSAAALADLQEMLRRAEDALVIHWHGFMKTAADVLSEDSAEQPAHDPTTSEAAAGGMNFEPQPYITGSITDRHHSASDFLSSAEQPAAGPVSLPRPDTPRVNAIFGSDTAEELQELLEKIAREFWFDKLARIVATTTGCYEAATALPLLEKMEAFLEVIQEQRARHLQRHPQMTADSIFSEADMKEIVAEWMGDYSSWMNTEKLREYEQQLASTDRRAQQMAHQMRRSAFSVFLFQVLGNKHILLACIQVPICSAVQPANPNHTAAPSLSECIESIMQAWDTEKMSNDYLIRREISEKRTEERTALKKAAHAARQEFVRARRIDGAIEKGMRALWDLSQQDRKLLDDFNSGKLARIRDDADAAFGFNRQMRDAVGTAAGRLCH